MPNYISADVKDLINKMLQPNPVKRITMKEIKEQMEVQRQIFIQGAIDNNVKKELAIEIFNLVEITKWMKKL